ncbi:SDR family NAD(P)-dependent oxidoreductase [Paraburkholderia saeva]|uniref:3-phenylpropionate-dihydrodiol/cinnamic acid-dihydrodiol dehydrogenase n=1 Tax=Paraburkholderia saeva TaxID=2777537 RepID=A0A9N8RV79_9BURK|nr:SDR family NAD(P)-dependent oxidoreductase [Paraburkholderia saeva]CAG4896576.1 3-phenylpropionate-dihydrodiol/cinnamic acid-dihydrodiol dehydrogenase [Paraburkholderia saeva]CAG4910680.1 3-phenylpropionate-dihydrodiol/cinnamic acid-dihydrodiol dehydrogenase [Paraburkholderia saeva]
MTDVKGRTAFITGGGNGIGLGIARSLAREGVKLALADIDAAGLARAKAELQGITSVEAFQLDVRDRDAYAETAEAVERALGPVTLLFNNAGVAGASPVGKLTYDLWDWYIGINLHGVINGVQTFLPKMLKGGQGGHIVNTASGAGLVAANAGVLYTTSKFGVVGMSEALSAELGLIGIGVSVLCPGPVATDIVQRSMDAAPKADASLSEAQERRVTEGVAQAIQYLKQGVSIDEVGAMVLKAIQENSLYIHTDRQAEALIKARTKALLDAMPS